MRKQTVTSLAERWMMLVVLMGLAHCAAQAAPLRVLILTGQNNHNWRQTTPMLEQILKAGGTFTVDTTTAPQKLRAKDFARYDVIVSNWNTYGRGAKIKEWPEQTRQEFMAWVRGGGGFVVVHAGGSMFPKWKEFHQLISATWGKGTGHGPRHDFEVKFTNTTHPICKGLKPFKTHDELWHRMVKQPDVTVLATAFSAKDKRGTGENEPMVYVNQCGKGRCFNLVLGHDAKAMESPGFKTLLRRGAEWAATGKVVKTANETGAGGTEPARK